MDTFADDLAGPDQALGLENAVHTARTAKVVRRARLTVYQGAPHGLCVTHKDRVNSDLLAFLRQ